MSAFFLGRRGDSSSTVKKPFWAGVAAFRFISGLHPGRAGASEALADPQAGQLDGTLEEINFDEFNTRAFSCVVPKPTLKVSSSLSCTFYREMRGNQFSVRETADPHFLYSGHCREGRSLQVVFATVDEVVLWSGLELIGESTNHSVLRYQTIFELRFLTE